MRWAVAFLVLLFFICVGQILLNALHIPMASFQLAGSLVLLLFGLRMVGGGVFPLAIPGVAGAGAIMTVMLLTDNKVRSLAEQAETTGILALCTVPLFGVFASAGLISRLLGRSGIEIISRVFGLILASIAITSMIVAIKLSFGLALALAAAAAPQSGEQGLILPDLARELHAQAGHCPFVRRNHEALTPLAFCWNDGACLAACRLRAGKGRALRHSMTDIPLTTGQPDRGANAYQYTGHTIYDPLIAWELDVSDRPGKMIPGLATEWKVSDADKTAVDLQAAPGREVPRRLGVRRRCGDLEPREGLQQGCAAVRHAPVGAGAAALAGAGELPQDRRHGDRDQDQVGRLALSRTSSCGSWSPARRSGRSSAATGTSLPWSRRAPAPSSSPASCRASMPSW